VRQSLKQGVLVCHYFSKINEWNVIMHDDPRFFAIDDPKIYAAILPGVVLLCATAKFLFIPWMILGPCSVYMHELGHASSAMFSGYAALPLPLFTFWTTTPSLFAKCMVFLLCALMVFQGWRYKSNLWIVLGIVMILIQIKMTTSPWHRQEMIMIAGGCGGEIVFGTLFSLLWFYEMPRVARWDFWRFIFLPIGLYSLWSSSLMWHAAVGDSSLIPWGSIVGGDGDMDRLVRDFGWKPVELASMYWKMCRYSWILIGIHYAFGIYKITNSLRYEPVSPVIVPPADIK
jgi:hypothetical protein